ncbi:cytochrome P450 [Lasiosphaeris hirsuta]|uniref:Cytochrome P450 n=1 Tax=Lasiosphaeris hirsuta TaxID=260670 RepID=A0AA40A2T7_9PEZI|nr:cytochrome P450 [Lasiosphaeris hirsuta]
MHGDYQFLGTDDHFPIGALHKHLTRNLVGLIPAIQDDVHSAIDATFGADTEDWKSLNLWEALLGIVPMVTNRVVVGETCKNKGFVDSQVSFVDALVRNSFILNMFPKIMHPAVAPFVVLPNWWIWRKSFRIVGPVIEKRLHDMARKAAGDPEYEAWDPEECLVTWLIRQAQTDGATDKLDAALISKSLLPIEFAAIHTTVITGHNLLLDLLSSDPKDKYLEVLREETARGLGAEGDGYWTKTGLSSLYRTDSAIRESMRLSHFATALTHRKVIAKEGITNPAEGWHVPQGGYLMLDLAGTHHDPDLYPEPYAYDALRFSRVREEYEARPKEEKSDPEEAIRIKRLGMVTTSDAHLPFSHGRHAW